jgi:heme exporter protein B
MTAFFRAAFSIARKDLRAELRNKEVFTPTLFFGLQVIVLFSFSFEPTAEETQRIGGGLLWMAFLFAGMLAMNQSFPRETAERTLHGLRLAPIPPAAVFAGKFAANLAFVSLAEAVLSPLFAVFFNFPLLPVAGRFALVLVLGSWGLVATGTFFSAITVHTRMRELMMPLLLLPIAVPQMIALVEATSELFRSQTLPALWLRLLVGYDVIFTTLALLLFGYVIEDA